MVATDGILIGRGDMPVCLALEMANRHGLITRATETEKTVILQIFAEYFSNAGVPVFLADVKGDLTGLSMPGALDDGLMSRARSSRRATLGRQSTTEAVVKQAARTATSQIVRAVIRGILGSLRR